MTPLEIEFTNKGSRPMLGAAVVAALLPLVAIVLAVWWWLA